MDNFSIGYFTAIFLMYPIWLIFDLIDWIKAKKNNKEDDE